MSRRRPAVLVLTVLVLLLAAAALLARAWWRGGLPQRSGEARLAGLAASVEVRWDRWGVPHVLASSPLDLAAALGWLHANDRMTQLELGRRAAAGRLAEAVGPDAVEVDRRARLLLVGETARRWAGALSAESRQWLEAYAGGVDAWVEGRRGDLPPGLRLLGIEPAPWTVADSLGFAVMMARDLSFWQGRPEEDRFVWLAQVGPERLSELFGRGLHLPAETVAAAARAPRAERGPTGGGAPGSNNWALAPRRSALERALVANDPHLPFRLPATWYQVHLRAPGLEVQGMTLPGIPGVVIGQTADLAWALTNVMLDDHDVFLEELDEAGERVRRGSGWRPIEVRREEIAVRDGEPVTVELRSTEIGPLLPAEPEVGLPVRSLAWTAHLPSDPLADFLHLLGCRRAEEVPEGLGGFVAPAQNLVVADRAGTLSYTILGRLPDRRGGDGRLPAPAWDAAYGWNGLLPVAAHPRVVDPDDGMLVTANHDLADLAAPPELVAEPDQPFRRDRIRQLLAGRERWAPGELATVQNDLVDLYARRIVSLLPAVEDPAAERVRRRLEGWDGVAAAGSGAAALFAVVERELSRAIFADDLDVGRASWQVRRDWLLAALGGELSAGWFDDSTTPRREAPRETVARALRAAGEEARRRWGDDLAGARWGELHPLALDHPLSRVPLLGRLWSRGPFPMGGSQTTVLATGGDWEGDRRPVDYGPSMRWIAVVGDGDAGLAVLPSGQSGHPADPHYDDQVELFLAGRLRSLAWSEAAVEATTVERLRLVPEPRAPETR